MDLTSNEQCWSLHPAFLPSKLTIWWSFARSCCPLPILSASGGAYLFKLTYHKRIKVDGSHSDVIIELTSTTSASFYDILCTPVDGDKTKGACLRRPAPSILTSVRSIDDDCCEDRDFRPLNVIRFNLELQRGIRVVSSNMDSVVDAQQGPFALESDTVSQAAAALLKYCSQGPERKELEESADETVFVQIVLKQAPRRATFKPRAVSLVHPLYVPNDDDVCFFVKDPQRLVKDHLAEKEVKGITKVMGVSKLRKRYGTHEGRRELAQMYDLFLADDRVLPMMPNLLGKPFIVSKKMPLPVRMDRDIPNALRNALHSTSFMPGSGTTCSVRVAKLSFNSDQITANVMKCMDQIVAFFPTRWSAFQALYIKSTSSPALPVFISLPSASDFGKSSEISSGISAVQKKSKTRKSSSSGSKVKDMAVAGTKLVIRKQRKQKAGVAPTSSKKRNSGKSNGEKICTSSEIFAASVRASVENEEAINIEQLTDDEAGVNANVEGRLEVPPKKEKSKNVARGDKDRRIKGAKVPKLKSKPVRKQASNRELLTRVS